MDGTERAGQLVNVFLSILHYMADLSIWLSTGNHNISNVSYCSPNTFMQGFGSDRGKILDLIYLFINTILIT